MKNTCSVRDQYRTVSQQEMQHGGKIQLKDASLQGQLETTDRDAGARGLHWKTAVLVLAVCPPNF